MLNIAVLSVVIRHQAKGVSLNTREQFTEDISFLVGNVTTKLQRIISENTKGLFMKEYSTCVDYVTTKQLQRVFSANTRGLYMKESSTHVKNVIIRQLQRVV